MCNKYIFSEYIVVVGTELSFIELRSKQVVNVIDGKVLGRICDVVFSRQSAKVLGFIVPGEGGFSLFKRRNDLFIPYERICKIGMDVVLVELKPMHASPHHHHEILDKPKHPHGRSEHIHINHNKEEHGHKI